MTKKVLVVDDEEDMVRLLQLTLADDPRYDFLMATDGTTALEVAGRERPDVVFLDISMPDIDGYQVCQALKADPKTGKARVVMLTALAQEFDRQKAADAGADGYITKPFSPTALLDKLDELLGGDTV